MTGQVGVVDIGSLQAGATGVRSSGGSGGGGSSSSSQSAAQDRALTRGFHGVATDIVHGRSVAIAFGVVGVLALLSALVSLWIYLNPAGYYGVGSALLTAIGRDPVYWDLIVWFPLGSGAMLALLSLLMVSFSLLSSEKARQFDDNIVRCCGGGCAEWLIRRHGGTNKCLVYAFSVWALVCVLLQTVIVLTALQFLIEADDAINSGAMQDIESNTTAARVVGFGYAVFNSCCAAEAWSQQGPIPRCDNDAWQAGDPVPGCTVPAAFSSYQDELCTCFHLTPEEEVFYQQQVAEFELCSLLSEATVTVDDSETVPGTAVSIRKVISAAEVRVVGDFAASYQGCGVGFGLGFQWVLYRWMYDFFFPLFCTLLGFSLAQALAVFYAIYRRWSGTQTKLLEHKMNEEARQWELEAQVAAGGGRQHASSSVSKYLGAPMRKMSRALKPSPKPAAVDAGSMISTSTTPRTESAAANHAAAAMQKYMGNAATFSLDPAASPTKQPAKQPAAKQQSGQQRQVAEQHQRDQRAISLTVPDQGTVLD